MSARASRRGPVPQQASAAAPPASPLPIVAPEVSCLALDIGTHRLGAVALNAGGHLCWWELWDVRGTLPERLTAIDDRVSGAILGLQPGMVVIERGFGAHHAPELEALFRMMPQLCKRNRARYREYTVSAWRKTTVGDGGAPKEVAAQRMRAMYPDLTVVPLDTPLDVLDAFGLAICYWEREGSHAARRLAAAGIVDPGVIEDVQASKVRTIDYRQRAE